MTLDADGRVRFQVRGPPVPQGSLRAFVVKGKARLTHDKAGPIADWRHAIRAAAEPALPPELWTGPVMVRIGFHLDRPKSEPTHAGRGKNRHEIRTYPDRRPDLDKLVRAVLDALTGTVWKDDSQVVALTADKDWGTPGATVEVSRLR